MDHEMVGKEYSSFRIFRCKTNKQTNKDKSSLGLVLKNKQKKKNRKLQNMCVQQETLNSGKRIFVKTR